MPPYGDKCLTHLPLVPHICVNELGHHWFRQWLVACSVPSHCLNQCWLIVNWTPGNIFQWNLNRNSIIFIQDKRPVGLSSFVNCPPVVASFLTQRQLSVIAGWQHMGRVPHPYYINPGYGLSLVDTLWNASSYRQPLEQEGDPMTWIEKFWLQISLIVAKK